MRRRQGSALANLLGDSFLQVGGAAKAGSALPSHRRVAETIAGLLEDSIPEERDVPGSPVSLGMAWNLPAAQPSLRLGKTALPTGEQAGDIRLKKWAIFFLNLWRQICRTVCETLPPPSPGVRLSSHRLTPEHSELGSDSTQDE